MVTGTAQTRRKLADNARRVRDRIAKACDRAGRDPANITLIAVTKYVEVDVIRQTMDAGFLDLGESRVQELTKRAAMIQESLSRRRLGGASEPTSMPRWHMVGHLQRNKVKAVLPWVEAVHSLDSLRLAEEINAQAARMGRVIPLLMQLNVSKERSKYGVAVGAATHLAEQVSSLPNVKLIGLMAMAPVVQDAEQARPVFARMREIFEDVVSDRVTGEGFRHLSMGMSQDFEAAIMEGATMIRIGTALFDGVGNFPEDQREAS